MLLQRLGLPFEVAAPLVDESGLAGETPGELVYRLARLKCSAVSALNPDALVIGSDQVAECNGRVVGKPLTPERARSQLESFSGRVVQFLTAVHLRCESRAFEFSETITTRAEFRPLDREEIGRYIAIDQPLDCAGSFKSEAAGISLLRSLDSADPTAIVGLPLITVAAALRSAGFLVP